MVTKGGMPEPASQKVRAIAEWCEKGAQLWKGNNARRALHGGGTEHSKIQSLKQYAEWTLGREAPWWRG